MSGANLPPLAPALIAWHRSHGRHGLPWQNTSDPYRVWLSEVMLQQTQVSTVLDYYPRFLARFPSVAELAAAPLDDVLALWSGLGYYSRARNLHRCAQSVVSVHGGQFPGDSASLAALPGIGRSTAAAIAAFCFGEKAAILDGNVKRVLTRVLGFEHDLAKTAHERSLWQLAQALLPDESIGTYTQALMDLGATLCTQKRPACSVCPWAEPCVARGQGRQLSYPVKTRKLKRSRREDLVLQLHWQDRVWLVQRPPTGVWAGLWTMPLLADADALRDLSAAWPAQPRWLPPFKHVLTHLDWWLTPCVWQWPDVLSAAEADQLTRALPPGRWFTGPEAAQLGLPAPMRKLLAPAPGLDLLPA